jgi:hypothetical protein
MSRELENGMRSRVLLVVLPLLLALGGPAFARGGGTLDSILPEIRAQHPGRMSDAEPFTASDGSTHYRIKWMTPEGRIIYFDADARSGRYFDSGGNGGGPWHRGGDDSDRRWRDRGDSDAGDDDNGGRHHRDWNAGDWPQGENGNGEWHGHHDGGSGEWRGNHGGNWSGERGGDWRGGHSGGDNGGSHHHHGG